MGYVDQSQIEGLGTVGAPLGGVLTVQGDPAGEELPIATYDAAGNAITSAAPQTGIRALDVRGFIFDSQSLKKVFVTNRNELKVCDTTRLIGETQEGTVLDANIWSQTLVGSGSNTLGNALAQLTTGATANSSVFLASLKKARFITATVNAFHSALRLGDTGAANNVRRWGAYDANNGVFFQLNGTTPGIGRRQTAVDTIVTVFNGPNPFVLDTNFHTYEIAYTQGHADFYQDQLLIHSITTQTSAMFDTPHLKLGFENTNSGGGTANVSLYLRGSAIQRYGEETARVKNFYASTSATTLLKRGPGTLKDILITSLGSGTITLYDSLTGSGTIIATVDLANQLVDLAPDFDFDTGLTAVKSSNNGVAIINYD